MNEQIVVTVTVWLICFNMRGTMSTCCFWAMVVIMIDLTEAEEPLTTQEGASLAALE